MADLTINTYATVQNQDDHANPTVLCGSEFGYVPTWQRDQPKSLWRKLRECAESKEQLLSPNKDWLRLLAALVKGSNDVTDEDMKPYLQSIVDQYNADCESLTGRISIRERVSAPSLFSSISLPGTINSTVAVTGAEGVYGSSTVTPWEAAVAREAKAMGQSVKEFAMPALVLGLLAFGALKAVETGDTATFQRAWAMVR